MDINNLSQKELADLISQANKRKKVLAKRKPINQVRAAVNRVVRTSGYTMEELFGTARSVAGTRKAPAAKKTAARKAASKVAPKYRNPANEKDTWTGRGRQPRWVAAEIANGRKLEDLLIK